MTLLCYKMSRKSMKILLFSTSYLPFIGGAELAVKEITDRLDNFEFDLITARISKNLPDFGRLGNINIHRLGIGNKIFDKVLLANLGFLKAINLYKKNKYNLIHGIMASHGSIAGFFLKLFYPKIPFILTLQEGSLDFNSSLERFWQIRIIKKADAITAISNYLADFARRFNKYSPIYIIPNGVDFKKFKIKKSKIKKKGTEKEIITVSRLVPKNGIDILVEAFSILVNKFKIKNLNLTIIGSGEEKEFLINLTKKLALGSKVKFLGKIPNEEILDYLVKADVFVRPSRSEGLGNAFLEAMAVGIPIIGTPVGGIPDFLIDRETGLFSKINDPYDLANKILTILEDDGLRKKLIKNAFGIVKNKYDWDVIARRMKEVYESFLI